MTIADLRKYGADVDSGLERCINNETLYLRLVGMALEDRNFDKLFQAIEDKDLDSAFEAAHAIKGACGNLSLTPIVEPVSTLTEYLRSRTDMDYSSLIAEIKEAYEALRALSEEQADDRT